MIGTLKNNNTEVWVEDLVGSTYFDLYNERLGTYIPWDELLTRTIYGWFSRMDTDQILQSDTMISKILITN